MNINGFRKFALILATAAALLAAVPNASAARAPRQETRVDLRFRVAGIYGNQMYGTGPFGRQPTTTLTLLKHGMRSEFEVWIPDSRFGLIAQGDLYTLAYNGRTNSNGEQPLHFGLGSLNLGWRIWGGAHAHASQAVLSAGLALSLYPHLNTTSSAHYERNWARLAGLRFGLRNRHALFSGVTFEWGGYYIQPQKLMTSGSLSKTGTRSFGATVLFDIRVHDGISLGLGYTGGLNRLVFTPDGATEARFIDYNSNSALLSLMFWL